MYQFMEKYSYKKFSVIYLEKTELEVEIIKQAISQLLELTNNYEDIKRNKKIKKK